MRSLKSIVQDIEAKLGPLEVSAMEKTGAETAAKNEDSEDSNTKTKDSEQSTQTLNSPDKAEVSAILNKNSAENAVNNEDSEHKEKMERVVQRICEDI